MGVSLFSTLFRRRSVLLFCACLAALADPPGFTKFDRKEQARSDYTYMGILDFLTASAAPQVEDKGEEKPPEGAE
jgi:hypothetical protein